MTTGHEKANITVILAASADGKKKKPFVVFKGKGKGKDLKDLKARRDIHISWSNNGWGNEEIVEEWLNYNFNDTSFLKRLLIWDAFRGHISDATKKVLKRKRIDQAVIPGGCTGLLQAPDVVWNKPFKVMSIFLTLTKVMLSVNVDNTTLMRGTVFKNQLIILCFPIS